MSRINKKKKRAADVENDIEAAQAYAIEQHKQSMLGAIENKDIFYTDTKGLYDGRRHQKRLHGKRKPSGKEESTQTEQLAPKKRKSSRKKRAQAEVSEDAGSAVATAGEAESRREPLDVGPDAPAEEQAAGGGAPAEDVPAARLRKRERRRATLTRKKDGQRKADLFNKQVRTEKLAAAAAAQTVSTPPPPAAKRKARPAKGRAPLPELTVSGAMDQPTTEATMDVWAASAEAAQQTRREAGNANGFDTSLRRQAKPKRTARELAKAMTHVVDGRLQPVHPGASFNPAADDHNALLQEAVALHERERVEAERLALQLRGQDPDAPEPDNAPTPHPDADEDDEASDEGVSHLQRAEHRRLTPEELRKRKLKRERAAKHARRLAEDRLNKQIKRLPGIVRTIDAEAEALDRRKQEIDEKKLNPDRPPRLGPQQVEALPPEVALPDELDGSLRNVKVSKDAVKDQFLRFQQRHLVEPRAKHKLKRRYKMKTFVRNSSKAISHSEF